jgi:predicted ester cyclase
VSIEENKALVRRYFEDAPYHPVRYNEMIASKVTGQALSLTDHPEFSSDPLAEQAVYARHIEQWGRWSQTIDDMIAEGDPVMLRWTLRGIHQSTYLGIPPTHRQVTFLGIDISRIESGRIVDIWNMSDRLDGWQQLGILPSRDEILAGAKQQDQPE